MMGKIVAIGGGELRFNETFQIDQFIVEFSGVKHPKLLFIPTASHDSTAYIESIQHVYGQQLGCVVDVLLLVDNDNIKQKEIQEKVLTSDIIYVGGGNTSMMMELWKKHKVDEYLKEAYQKNIVLSGLSAGSICWFLKGHSDSNSFTNSEGSWDYVQIEGLGLIPAIHCPHYNEDGREDFDEMMKNTDLPGIAIENNCAIVINNDRYKVIQCNASSKAYVLQNCNGIVSKQELVCNQYSPLSDILP